MIVVPYKAEHLLDLQIQEGQRGVAPFITEAYAKALEDGYTFSALEDGRPLVVGGIAKVWDNRGLVWAFMGQNAGPHFVAIHKAAMGLLAKAPYRRLEADTPCGFEQGHRWLRMLGFKLKPSAWRLMAWMAAIVLYTRG